MKQQLAVVSAVALACAAVGTARTATPALSVSDRSPLTTRGTGFLPRERVVVTASVNGVRSRRIAVTSRAGVFAVRFDGIRLDACTGAMLVATGARGDYVRMKIALRQCPAPDLDP